MEVESTKFLEIPMPIYFHTLHSRKLASSIHYSRFHSRKLRKLFNMTDFVMLYSRECLDIRYHRPYDTLFSSD